MRWRVEKEVLSGKGESICGSTKCSEKLGLGTFEVNFKYKEDSEWKNTLVKVKVCSECAGKLNHKVSLLFSLFLNRKRKSIRNLIRG